MLPVAGTHTIGAVAVAAFEGQSDKELTFGLGDPMITEYAGPKYDKKGWVRATLADGRTGVVPKGYLRFEGGAPPRAPEAAAQRGIKATAFKPADIPQATDTGAVVRSPFACRVWEGYAVGNGSG